MSPFDFLRRKVVTGREARAIGAAVARAECAEDVRRCVAELARTVRSAERMMAAHGIRLVPVSMPLGIPVDSRLVYPGEGCEVSPRMSRFFFLRPSRRSPLLLPEWAVQSAALTKIGVRCINRHTNLRRFDDVRRDLVAALIVRESEARRNLARIPKGAIVSDVIEIFPAELRQTILEVFRR